MDNLQKRPFQNMTGIHDNHFDYNTSKSHTLSGYIVPARVTVPPVKSYFFKLSCYGRRKNGTGYYSVRKGANLQGNT